MAALLRTSARMLAVLISLACTADALEQSPGLRGGARQQTPPLSLSSARKQQEKIFDEVGPFAWDANTVGVRLPDNMPSPAWGADKLKAQGSDGLVTKDYAAGRFFSGGTDGKTEAHGLAGIGYAGFANKLRPDVRGLVAAAKADQEGVDILAVVPRPEANGAIGVDYARTSAKLRSGHIPAGQLPKARLGAKDAITMDKVVVKASRDEPLAVLAAAEESYNKTESEILTSRFKKDFNDYQLKLMILDFPYQSALWFATMRAWCNHPEHGLGAAEEARRLKTLEGKYKVIKDGEYPQNAGLLVTIQDGKLLHSGESIMGTTFKAYVDNKYAAVTPLRFPTDNSTVELHKIFTIDGSRILFEGGNIWERAQVPAPALSTKGEWWQRLLLGMSVK